jgi:hypothetical protein
MGRGENISSGLAKNLAQQTAKNTSSGMNGCMKHRMKIRDENGPSLLRVWIQRQTVLATFETIENLLQTKPVYAAV